MDALIPGLHHVTATVADARDDLEFFTDHLGLRLVKKTVNFDNHFVYHFYYGDERGTPSTIMTTFPYKDWGVPEGTKGAGQVTVTSFSVPRGAVPFWSERLAERGVAFDESTTPFGEAKLAFQDPSGLNLEVIESDADDRTPWLGAGIPEAAAIRGVHGVTLLVREPARSLAFLTEVLGFEVLDRTASHARVSTGAGGPGRFLEVVRAGDAPDAVNGIGTVHHVALAIADEHEQLRIRRELLRIGCSVTDVRDRQYFRSIYFREPGGVLYEIATLGPGFDVDEAVAELGAELKLPPWEEPNRSAIVERLPKLRRD